MGASRRKKEWGRGGRNKLGGEKKEIEWEGAPGKKEIEWGRRGIVLRKLCGQWEKHIVRGAGGRKKEIVYGEGGGTMR